MKAQGPVGATLALLLTGCAGVIPVPRFSRQPESGTIIHPEQIRFIQAGQTMRPEVTNRLGSEFRESRRVKAIAYPWELPGGSGCWWVASAGGGAAGEFEWSHWRAFFVLFDADGVVVRTEFVRLSGGKSLDEHLERWAVRAAGVTRAGGSRRTRQPTGSRPGEWPICMQPNRRASHGRRLGARPTKVSRQPLHNSKTTQPKTPYAQQTTPHQSGPGSPGLRHRRSF